jgi:hypothetical protein
MISDFLLLTMPSAKYKIKLFLIKWVLKFEINSTQDGRVANLAIEFGFSKRAVTDSLKYLVQHGYLFRDQLIDSVGNKTNGFYLSEKLKVCSSKMANFPPSFHHHRIMSVLGKPNNENGLVTGSEGTQRVSTPKTVTNDCSTLTEDCVYVLSVLLRLADSRGVVKGYGLKQLSKYLSMTVEQIKPRLLKLSASGNIKHIVPGITGKDLFGVRPNIYVLDIKHDLFGELFSPGPTITDNAVPPDHDTRAESYDFIYPYLSFPSLISSIEFSAEEKKDVIEFFKSVSSRQRNYLQIHLHEWASIMLTAHFEGLDGLSIEKTQFEEQIAKDVLPAKYLGENNGGFPNAEQKKLLSVVLFKISLQIAKSFKCWFSLIPDYDIKEVEFFIHRQFKSGSSNHKKQVQREFILTCFEKDNQDRNQSNKKESYLISELRDFERRDSELRNKAKHSDMPKIKIISSDIFCLEGKSK